MGGRREEIVNQIYRSRSLNVLKLWGRVLARLTSKLDNKLIWSTLNCADFDRTNSCEKDLVDVIDELIVNIPQAKVIVLFYENNNKTQDTKTNALVYSIKNIDSLNLLREYNPTGTKNLAKVEISKPLVEVEKTVVDLIESKLNKLPI